MELTGKTCDTFELCFVSETRSNADEDHTQSDPIQIQMRSAIQMRLGAFVKCVWIRLISECIKTRSNALFGWFWDTRIQTRSSEIKDASRCIRSAFTIHMGSDTAERVKRWFGSNKSHVLTREFLKKASWFSSWFRRKILLIKSCFLF